jgi:hypothetical protein
MLYVSNFAQELNLPTDILISRAWGRRLFALLMQKVQSTHQITFLSLAKIEAIDVSFADEVFGTWVSARLRDEIVLPPLILSDVNETVLENIEAALRGRPHAEQHHFGNRLRNYALPYQTRGDLLLVGEIEEAVNQAFNLLRVHRHLTPRQMADMLKISANSASNRLKALFDLGLAVREETRDESGKLYIYRWLV